VTYDANDIVVVPFPFTDKSTSKRRPALVLSQADTFNNTASQSVLAMITSAKNSDWPLDIEILDLDCAGLPSPSVVRMKLFTLDHKLIIRKAGVLSSGDQLAVIGALGKLFGLK
jgi:mRNA interferase MazF